MNTLFATSASPVRRVMLATLLALSLVLLMLAETAHTAQAACTSRLTHVTNFNTATRQTVYISGQCLGTNNAYTAKDSNYLYIHVFDGTSAGWNACYGYDGVTCSVQYWGQNEIVFSGFAGYYGLGPYKLNLNEAIVIEERSPQNPVQWSKCTVYVGYASNCLNDLASTYQGIGHNTTYNITTNFALTSLTEDLQGNIRGYTLWTAPLYGSGPFTGKVYDDGGIVFTSIANDGSGFIDTFTGKVNPNGSITGNYTGGGQSGTWQVSPA